MRLLRSGSDVTQELSVASRRFLNVALVAVAAGVLSPQVLQAQQPGGGYRFSTPHNTFTIRTGYDVAMANSDLWDFVTTELTVKKSDFGSAMIAGDYGFRLSSQVDGVLGIGYARAVARSQYRGWLDNNNLPIQQQSEFTRLPLTVGLKWNLTPPGRSIGRYAWVPARFTPYVGGAVGTMWYKFRQAGDFIDTTTTNVFTDAYQSSGWAPMAAAYVGGDISINPSMALNIEARYTASKGSLSNDYVGFNRIDLSGTSFTAGLTFRF